ncbi:MAG: transglycosylase SLT domain-containing protein [Gemmatimonadaceae bacterium]
MAATILVVLLAWPARGRAQGRGAVKRAASALERAAQQKARENELARYDPLFSKYSKRHFGVGFDWRIFKAQGMAESGLDPTARSWVGARGIMQLMPTTFQAIQSRRPEFTSIDDPEWNIAAGIAHDRYLWRLFEKDVGDAERRRFMFASYNAGEGTIARARKAAAQASLDRSAWKSIEQVAPKVPRWRYRETVGYVKKIEGNIERLKR